MTGGGLNRDFAGKVTVVTGAGSGIGRATALLLARLRAKVHVSDLDGAPADAVRAEIEAAAGAGRATADAVDVTDPTAVESLAGRVFAEDGAVDVLHNHAGFGHAGRVEDTTLEGWQRVLGVNLMGTVHGIHFFVPRMLRQGRPAHAVTASGLGLLASAQLAPYCASKFGVVGLSEALNAELWPQGIRVTAVCPGIIDTSITWAAVMRGARADPGDAGLLPPPRSLAGDRRRRDSQGHPDQDRSALARRPRVDPQRISPRASQVLSRRLPQLISRGGVERGEPPARVDRMRSAPLRRSPPPHGPARLCRPLAALFSIG